MIQNYYWVVRMCDLCRKDESLLQPRLAGVMENGNWVGGFTQDNLQKAKKIRAEWEQEISCPCVVFHADMEEVVICEKHLAEVIARKNEFIQ